MKLLIDTSLKNLFITIVKDGKTIAFINETIQKKADRLPFAFEEILKEANISTKDIKEFYVTSGPGSFMGARTALTFIRTICQLTNAKLFVGDTLSFISGGTPGTYFIDAKSEKSYQGVVNRTTIISLEDFQEDSIVPYEDMIANPEKYLSTFLESDPIYAKPSYFKDPQIGGK